MHIRTDPRETAEGLAARRGGWHQQTLHARANGLVIPPIRRSGPHHWRLECDWSVRVGRHTVTVPGGRETDLADVPGVLRPALRDRGFGIAGPLVHDFIYEHAGRLQPPACRPAHAFTRREADHLLWGLMRVEGVSLWRRVLAYVTVRLAGYRHWRRADRT